MAERTSRAGWRHARRCVALTIACWATAPKPSTCADRFTQPGRLNLRPQRHIGSHSSHSSYSSCVGRSRPWLNYFAWFLCVATLLLICSGGMVTSKNVGLAVPDWPTTFGYNMFLFPVSKWVGGILFEHTHRLIASAVGFLTIILAIWLWRSQEPQLGPQSRPDCACRCDLAGNSRWPACHDVEGRNRHLSCVCRASVSRVARGDRACNDKILAVSR